MALTTVANIKLFLGIPSTNVAEDARLGYLLTLATAAITAYLGRNIESAAYTEYYSGNGMRLLALRQRPVTAVSRVNIDPTGYYGQGTAAFPVANDLIAGTDYSIVYDSEPGAIPQSRRGILERINGGVWDLLSRDYFNSGFFGFPYLYAAGTGKLAHEVSTRDYGGNILVVYTAGYPAPVPSDLELAANLWVSMLRRTARFGGASPQSESLGEYSYSLFALSQMGMTAEVGTIRSLLSFYKEVVF